MPAIHQNHELIYVYTSGQDRSPVGYVKKWPLREGGREEGREGGRDGGREGSVREMYVQYGDTQT